MVLTRNLYTTKMQTTLMSEVCSYVYSEVFACSFVDGMCIHHCGKINPLPSMRHFYFVITYKSLVRRFVESKSIQHIYISSFRCFIEWSFSHPEDEQADTPGVAAVQA